MCVHTYCNPISHPHTHRAVALETVTIGQLTLAGPLALFRGTQGLVARIPIFLDNQTADEVITPFIKPSTTYPCHVVCEPGINCTHRGPLLRPLFPNVCVLPHLPARVHAQASMSCLDRSPFNSSLRLV